MERGGPSGILCGCCNTVRWGIREHGEEDIACVLQCTLALYPAIRQPSEPVSSASCLPVTPCRS